MAITTLANINDDLYMAAITEIVSKAIAAGVLAWKSNLPQ